jgi:hypothetical protein
VGLYSYSKHGEIPPIELIPVPPVLGQVANANDPDSPETNDTLKIYVWILMSVLTGTTAFIMILKKKKEWNIKTHIE